MQHGDGKRWRDGLSLLGLLVPWGALVWRFWFVCDDAYISLRYARSWAEGLGLRYNVGEAPVEGFSNFLLVAIGSLLHRAGLDLERSVPFVGALSGVALIVLAYASVRRHVHASRTVAFLAVAGVAWSAPFAVWSSGGLETMLFSLLLFATFERLVLREGRPAVLVGALLALALALTRVEGILWVVLVLGLAGVARRLRGERVRVPLLATAAIVALGFGAFTLWRYRQFGLWQASTVHAKVDFGTERFVRGLSYVAVQFATTLPFLVVVPGLLFGLVRERRARVLPVALVSLAVAGFAVLVSGDFMAFGRFLVPALAFDALLLAWWLAALERGRGSVVALATGAGVGVLALLSAFDVVLVPRDALAAIHFRSNQNVTRSEVEYWREQRDNAARWAVCGEALRAISEPGDSVVLGAIGATAYRSGLFVFDRYGLVTSAVSTRERSPREELGDEDDLGAPGHDQPVDRTWFLAQGHTPTFLLAKLRRASSTAGLLQQMEVSLALMDEDVRRRYVFEFHGVPSLRSSPDDDSALCLFVWRRIAADRDPADAWRAADAARLRFERTGRMKTLDVAPVSVP
jgi:hypothetical protein